jgi:hypothetical protein
MGALCVRGGVSDTGGSALERGTRGRVGRRGGGEWGGAMIIYTTKAPQVATSFSTQTSLSVFSSFPLFPVQHVPLLPVGVGHILVCLQRIVFSVVVLLSLGQSVDALCMSMFHRAVLCVLERNTLGKGRKAKDTQR